ncbi:probable receptor-like protein kinase At5g24010 [Alnus glutinosa]|uniref:probable receptor-like protein kinase At5g24010 n=1 Tax=Alnus glutinosa TaxID=3517 RepID=UPI002D76DDA9|nr:probable receptor-like protein kinase At5g24010 [Alnus glutinosa]
MEFPYRNFVFVVLLLSLCTLSALSYTLFSPIDNYLIDCGSTVDSIVDNRRFVSDSSRFDSYSLTSTRSVLLRNEDCFDVSPQIYQTARVFTGPSRYEFEIRDKGTHMVRLHFHKLNSSKFDFGNAQFHVLVNGFVVLSDFFGGCVESPRVKEYLIWVETEKLVITFVPSRKYKFAFVNALEVISAPKDLILDTVRYVNSEKNEKSDGLVKQALEVVYRVTVGGPKVTPFNGTLWRTWVPDDEFLKSSFGSKRLYFSGRIRYQKGGASREVAPDNVYNSARVISSRNASIPNVNITWVFPVVGGFKYLVRLHFCDIASISIGLLFFNVYVNGHLAIKNLDLSDVTNYVLASPYYADFMVDGDGSGALSVSVGPSNNSYPYAIDGILNAVEIMKLNNSMGSLAGKVPAEFIMKSWPRGNMGVLVPLVAAVCLLVILSMVLRRRMTGLKDSVTWSKLPLDVSDANVKQGYPQL